MFGLFDELFDMNRDGELSTFEEAAGLAMMSAFLDDAETDDDRDFFGEAGLDYDELEMMDPEDRNDVLEAAGLDPLEFDF